MKRRDFFIIILTLIFVVLDVNGCGKKESESSKTFKIGAILPLTGDIAPYGQSSKNGMEIAVSEFSKDVIPNLRVIYEDGKGNARESVNAMKKLVEVDKVPVVLGGIASSNALAMAPIAEESKTVLMCPFASSPKITTAGDLIFRIMPSDAFQGSLLPKWFNELNYNDIAIIYVKNDWGESLKNSFVSSFEESGGNIVLEESCNEGTKDVRNIVAKVISVKNKINAIFMPTYPEEGGLLLKQIKESGISVPIFGGDTWANDLLVQVAGEASEEAKFLAPMQYEDVEFIGFKEKYVQKFNKEPDLPAAAGYDAMKVVLFCLKNLVDKGVELTGENIKDALYKVKNFKGATGITTFDENGDVISKEFGKRIIKDGKIVNYE